MAISYGGESVQQHKKNLMKDNPIAKHSSGLNQNYEQPTYQYDDQPMELTGPGKKKLLASGANEKFLEVIANTEVDNPAKISSKIEKGRITAEAKAKANAEKAPTSMKKKY